jgi:hypothetical protein
LPLVKTAPLGPYRPYNLVRSSLTKEVGEVISEQLSWSLDPSASNLYFRQVQRLGELSKTQIEVLENLYRKLEIHHKVTIVFRVICGLLMWMDY